MRSKLPYLCLLTGILFACLFYRQLLGLNLLLFELILIGLSYGIHNPVKQNLPASIVLTGVLLSAVFVVLYGSDLAKTVNMLSLLIFTGYRLYEGMRSPAYALPQGIINLFLAPKNWYMSIKAAQSDEADPGSSRRLFYYFRLVVIPVLMLLVFICIYRVANAHFDSMLLSLLNPVQRFFEWLFRYVSIPWLLLALAGSCIAVPVLLKQTGEGQLEKADTLSQDRLLRERVKREKANFKAADLRREYKSAILLLTLLNLLILVVNCIDIEWVWISFVWDGSILKQFVHEGTYMLIIAVILSIIISLYVFRKNLNFYPQNKTLRYLAYAWLFQNGIMLISVAIRNLRYIEHFNLAHKRIGLFFFLLAVLWLIITVMMKIHRKRSAYYAIRSTTMGTYIILVLMAAFNWDNIIAAYNFAHARTAFLHRDWIVTLSDKTLPLMEANKMLLDVPFTEKSWHKGGSYSNYSDMIEKRKARFLSEYPERSLLSFNLADYKAYKQLSGK